MPSNLISVVLVISFLAAAASHSAGIAADNRTAELHAIFDAEWRRILKEDPAYASTLGDDQYAHLWPNVSLPARDRSEAETRSVLDRVLKIDPAGLSPADQLNRRLFVRQYETSVDLQQYRLQLLPLTQREGIQDASRLAELISFETTEDYEQWIRRLRNFPMYMAQTMSLMRQGIQEKMLHPKIVMQRVPGQIRRQLVEDPRESLYYGPFLEISPKIAVSDGDRLQREAMQAIRECIIPSYRTFLEFFENEYLPACYDEPGCWQRPNGQAMYTALAAQFTTTSLTPDEIHRTGLSEVDRIRREMEEIRETVGFAGTLPEFFEHLRSDRRFYFDDPNDLLNAYRECCRKIDPQLPRLFRRLPKATYEIRPIPSQMAPDTTTAYYQPPSADGVRPGGYSVNLYRPDMRPKYEIEALSLHEAVPGHHLQIAIAMELEDVPDFRRHSECTAFIEGWGLYSESLGEELGLYQDPYSKFGQLTYEMWRAVRLVVDTGIHFKQWTRQQAIDVFLANTAKSILDINNEVDRYIAWPGQALAYKIGELKIRALRTRAEQQLGSHFDVREFHEVVLGNGAMPLDVLEEVVN